MEVKKNVNTNDDGCGLRSRSKWQLSCVSYEKNIFGRKKKKEDSAASSILSSHTCTRTHVLCNPLASSIVLFISARHVKRLPSKERRAAGDVAAGDTSAVQTSKIITYLGRPFSFFFRMQIFVIFI